MSYLFTNPLYIDNPNLIYAILRNHQKFQKLAELSLDNALIEIERLRQLKEASNTNRLQRHSTDESQIPMSPDSTSSNNSNGIPLSEKAKGKLPEGSLSRVSSTSSLAQASPPPLRQSSISSVISTASLLPGAKNGFIPTDDWVNVVNINTI